MYICKLWTIQKPLLVGEEGVGGFGAPGFTPKGEGGVFHKTFGSQVG